ncbi:MAG: zinc metallopeptidase [Verrucomicrobiota bacterium]
MNLTLFLILVAIPILLGFYAQMRVTGAYQKNLQVLSRRGLTGREAAAAVMRSAGITDVEILEVPGTLSDHYNPGTKQLALSEQNYRGSSLAAVGVAAHEAGHAIQHQDGYAMMEIRQALVPMVQIASPIAYMVMSFGFYLAGGMGGLLLKLGIGALLVMVLFQLITLPVEFDATRRAKAQLVRLGIVEPDEMPGVNETLDAAALTYVAAFVQSLGQLLHLLLIFSGGRRNDD